MTRVEYSACCPQSGRSQAKFIFGGCGGRALREPPKITPLRGAVVRAAAFAPNGYLAFISRRNLRNCKTSSTAASSTETPSAIGIEYHTPSVPQRSGSTSSSGTMKSI